MRNIYFALLFAMFACLGCEWRMRSEMSSSDDDSFVVRYDRMEAFFLTTGDFSALQQMQTRYPMQTRLLIEELLQLGKVDDAHINTQFYSFFQDTTLQALIADVERQYKDMDELDARLKSAFERLEQLVPLAKVPVVYSQIGSLDQSVIVGDGMVGISLDKYLGADNPCYVRFGYSERQRSMMTREYIVPDCLGFYLLSLYPAPDDTSRNHHMGRIQHVVNTVLQQPLFQNESVRMAEMIMQSRKDLSFDDLLRGKGF